MSESAPDIFTRIRLNREAKKSGRPAPWPVGEPLLIGKCAQGRRILRVWPDTEGWALLVDGARIATEEHLRRTGGLVDGQPVSVEDIREGRVISINQRRTAGLETVISRDPASWPGTGLQVDCEHGPGEVAADSLAAAIESARTTRRRAWIFSTVP